MQSLLQTNFVASRPVNLYDSHSTLIGSATFRGDGWRAWSLAKGDCDVTFVSLEAALRWIEG